MHRLSATVVAIAAVMIAVVTVVTLLVRVPIPATQGYFNFSDVAIYFVAFTFGPWIGLIAGGIGTAIADVLGGYAYFAPITLVAHGLQGFLAGAIGRAVAEQLRVPYREHLRRADVKRRHTLYLSVRQEPFNTIVTPADVPAAIVVDDLISTGATMRLSLSALRGAGIACWGFALNVS